MAGKLIELRPESSLLNSEFSGYKLSLENIPILKTELNIPADHVKPNSEQYSFLHVKLFGLHNHLFLDNYCDCVYFVDKEWKVQRVSVNEGTGQMNPLKCVWQIPRINERKLGHYNISIHFSSKDVAVVSDGTGYLHIVYTGHRNEENQWKSVLSKEVLQPNKGFIIQDSIVTKSAAANKLHCLLINIHRMKEEEKEKYFTEVNWICFTEINDNVWGLTSTRVLKGAGNFYYCALERNCKYVYIASDNPFKFISDTENPIFEKKPEAIAHKPKVYTWVQSDDDIIIRFNVDPECKKTDVFVDVGRNNINVKYKAKTLLEGQITNRIDSELTTWNIMDNILEITIVKSESGQIWTDLIPGDDTGEQVIDPALVAEVHSRLAHLCSETEAVPSEGGPSFSTQQMEDCDFVGDNTAILQRFCSETHQVTHHVNLGSHQVILSVVLDPEAAPSLAIRHDVDACLWTPQVQEENEWSLKHTGTLFAFGYVQASKQQRKFLSCSPDLNYSVICESSRHVFIYRQSVDVESGTLRNRRSGRNVPKIAQQQVISLSDPEILGLSATNYILYLLTENEILALKIQTLPE